MTSRNSSLDLHRSGIVAFISLKLTVRPLWLTVSTRDRTPSGVAAVADRGNPPMSRVNELLSHCN